MIRLFKFLWDRFFGLFGLPTFTERDRLRREVDFQKRIIGEKEKSLHRILRLVAELAQQGICEQ
jgi:hypothetical protein